MNKKTNTFLLLAFLGFFITATIFLLTLYEVNRQGTRLTDSKQSSSEYTAKRVSFKRVESLFDSTTEDRSLLTSYFLKEADTINFISSIEASAAKLNLVLNTTELSITPAAVDTAGVATPALLIVGFDSKGSEEAVLKFISVLENMPYYKKITELSVVKEDANIWKMSSKLQLMLSV